MRRLNGSRVLRPELLLEHGRLGDALSTEPLGVLERRGVISSDVGQRAFLLRPERIESLCVLGPERCRRDPKLDRNASLRAVSFSSVCKCWADCSDLDSASASERASISLSALA